MQKLKRYISNNSKQVMILKKVLDNITLKKFWLVSDVIWLTI